MRPVSATTMLYSIHRILKPKLTFWRKAASHGQLFHTKQRNVTPSCGSRAVMPLLRSGRSLLLRTPQQTPNAFQWAKKTPELSLSVRDFDYHLMMVPWAHSSQSPNGISIGSAVFSTVYISVTDTQTDHIYDICRNRPHLCYACDAA